MLPPSSMLTIKNGVSSTAVAFLASVALLAGCAPPGPRALLDGKRLLEQGRYPQAVERLATATAILGTNALAWHYLGLACQYSGNLPKAEEAYRQALKCDPDLTEAHYNLGCVWLAQDRLDAAKGEFVAYTLRRGNSADGFLMLGAIQLRTNKSASVLSRARELEAAESSFNRALQLNPGDPEALNGLGLAKVQRGRPGDLRDAEQYFNDALKQHPGYPPALLNLAILSHQYLRNRQFALEKYREYLALKPAPEEFEAVQAIVSQLAQELNPPARPGPPVSPAPANTNLAVASLQAGTNASRTAPVARPDPGAVPRQASVAYVYQHPAKPVPGNRAEAQRAFEQGATAWQAHRLADAVQAYQKATQLDPAFYEAYFNLGLAASAAGNLPTSLAAYENALAVRPESADARYNFALTLQQANHFVDAASELDKMLAAFPNETRAHLALGNLCAQQLRRPAMARDHYRKVLELDPRTSQADAIRQWLSANP
jgi:tetratricopeptide (TPR) repeat protein